MESADAEAAAAAVAAEPEEDDQPEEAMMEGGEPDDELLARAQRLISKITASQENPNPRHYHALASLLEEQEARYLEETATSYFNGSRSSHAIGRITNILHDNSDFLVSISAKLLSESAYSLSVRAAAARLLLSGSSTWMVFEDSVLENAKNWVMDDTTSASDSDCVWKDELGQDKATDYEMLKTYATGILSMSLTGGGEIVEDVLTSGLSAKLMRFLRLRVLGDPSTSQKDANANVHTENKHISGSALKKRDDTKSRSHHVLEAVRLDNVKIGEEGSLCDLNSEKALSRTVDNTSVIRTDPWEEDEFSVKSDLLDSSEVVNVYDQDDEDAMLIDEQRQNRDTHSARPKYGERQVGNRTLRGEDTDENARDEFSRRRLNRGLSRNRGKGRHDGSLESDKILASPGSELKICEPGQSIGVNESFEIKGEDISRITDMKISNSGSSGSSVEDEDRFRCTVGSRSISDLVKKAVEAAEAEACAANAPAEAVRAAGDAAAELVKTSAMEVWKTTNDEEAAFLAASEAASTVVDASATSDSSRIAASKEDQPNHIEPEVDEEEPDDFFILDSESLSRLREKYCIQCLETLGEYLEALGPVLHEKGVDVCLSLLQRSLKQKEDSDDTGFLSEVLKLICALAAHKKFAALFVDRGGMQKLLAIQRVHETYFGLSSCLFTIGSLQGIMERVCALAPVVIHQVVELALQLLDCSQDQARKNAALFFASAFVFRAILDSFDAQEGLVKMLNLLDNAATVRSGGNSASISLTNTAFPNDRTPSEVLTASEKQIAYHTCVALRQYFRAHLLLLVDSIRPNKSNRSLGRNNLVARAAYKPLDISSEAMENVFLQIQRDRKLGPAFVRARWPAVDKFLAAKGHTTMLELCQAPPVERYLHDLAQYALGVLHIVTLVPYSRACIVDARLSNERVGMAVILDAANGAGFVEPEMIQPALEILVNLVCPPPSISLKPQGTNTDKREKNNVDRTITAVRSELRDQVGEPSSVERGIISIVPPASGGQQTPGPPTSSGLVGDRRISLGPGAGCIGLATQLEQGYTQAREAVRANNGIKVLLHLLNPRMVSPPVVLDRLRALACRVLLGLARDDAIAHILTKLQVGKRLSELIRDFGSPSPGTEQDRGQSELAQVAIELIAIVTNSGRASTLVATDAAAPTLRRIERAAIAAATPITYHSKELLLLIHEHLLASGLIATAALLQKEASLMPLPFTNVSQPPLHQTSVTETPSAFLQWPSGRIPCGFLTNATKLAATQDDDSRRRCGSFSSRKKKPLLSSITSPKPQQFPQLSSVQKPSSGFKAPSLGSPGVHASLSLTCEDQESHPSKTPILLPMKRKLTEKDFGPSGKRLAIREGFQSPGCQTPNNRRITAAFDGMDGAYSCDKMRMPQVENVDDMQCSSSAMASSLPLDCQNLNPERMTLDSLVVQYLKHQHRQCPAPITTLPPLSLLHPHVCPDPSRNLDAPANITARISGREYRKFYRGMHAHRRDRQFVYSRFRPWRTCRDDASPLTCITFLDDFSKFATGSRSGELKIYNSTSGNVIDSNLSHQTPINLIQSTISGETQLILSSSSYDIKLWDASLISGGPFHSFDGCKAARFNHSGTMFAAISSDASRREILLYDIQTYKVEQKYYDDSGNTAHIRGYVPSLIHFSPQDTMLLWNGNLWDRRISNPCIHHFDQFSDYGGGGFHPSGNEVIINSEVWDLRKFKLLRSVPSLDQTVITFNSGGDVIYAILRRNLDDLKSAVNMRRVRHPLFPAFRTIDAVNYSDIATIPIDRCVLDFASESSDSLVGVIAMDDHDDTLSSARLYEIGRRRPTDDDSDPDDGAETEEDDDDDDDSDGDMDALLGPDLDGDMDSEGDDDLSNDEDDEVDSGDDIDDDIDFNIDDVDFDGPGILELGSDGENDDSDPLESMSDDEGGFAGDEFGY